MKKPVHDDQENQNGHKARGSLESKRRYFRREVIHQADSHAPRDKRADTRRSDTSTDGSTICCFGADHTGRYSGQNQNAFQPFTKYEHAYVEHGSC